MTTVVRARILISLRRADLAWLAFGGVLGTLAGVAGFFVAIELLDGRARQI